MKICYITHDIKKNTGAGVFPRELARAVKELRPDWTVHFLASEDSGTGEENYIFSINKKDIWKNFFKIRKVLKQYDLIHSLDSFPYGVVAVLGTLGLNKKVFITAVGSGAIFVVGQWFRNLWLRWSYLRADKVFAVSSYIARQIRKKISKVEIIVINHGPGQKFSGEQPKNFYVPRPYILTNGYLKKRKGYEYSIRAFSECLKKRPELNYVIVGKVRDKDYQEKLFSLVEDLGLKEKVFFYSDYLTSVELGFIYSQAELFLLMPQETPSDVEGFGLVYLEAALHGLPVVGSKDSAAEDAVLDGKNGLLVKSDDISAISEAVLKILNDKELAKKFSEESKKFATLMTWEKAAREYIKYYEN